LRNFLTFGDEVCALGFVNASGVLVDAKCAMGCLAGVLCHLYFLIGLLLEGDLYIQFLRCSEPGIAFGINDPLEKILETLG
jgi:hypothetical protein